MDQLERCIVPGCEAIPDDEAKRIWEEAERRGWVGFRGKCVTHCNDRVARAKIEAIRSGKIKHGQSQKINGRSRSEAMAIPPISPEPTISSFETARVLKITIMVVDEIIGKGILETTYWGSKRGIRISKDSIRRFILMVLSDNKQLTNRLPTEVIKLLELRKGYYLKLITSRVLD